MLIQIFQRVMLLSVVGSAVGSIWLILKPITRKRFSPKWQYYIWLTTLVTLVFPVSFSLPQNTSAQSLSQIAIQNVTNVHQSSVYLEEIELPNSSALPVEAIKSTFTPTTQKTIHWLSILWLLGVLLSLIYRLTKYILFRIALYRNSANNTECLDVPKRLRVRNTAMLDAPLLVGLVRPILYLTLEKIDEVNLKYILQHELTHLKRHDLAYKWFALFAESIHWFNPIVYLISKQINEECEISCDYEVTSALSQQEQSCYMGMILDMAASAKVRKYMLTTQMISDKRMLRNRFLMIRNRINPRKKIRVLSVFAAVSILGSAVFTGGVLANELFSSDYIISVRNENKELIFDNRPFMEDNIVYLPVRETFISFDFPSDYFSWRQTSADVLKNNNGGAYEKVDSDSVIDEIVMYVPDEYIKASGNQSNKNLNHLRIGADEHIVNGYALLSFAGNGCVVRNGVVYAPYSFFEYCKHAYQNMLMGLNITISKPDKTIKFDTDVNPYDDDNQTALTLNDLAIISLNSDNWGSCRSYADFAGFISDGAEGNIISYPIDEEYVVQLEVQPDGSMIPWLWNIPFQNGKNLNGIRFDGTDPANEWNKQRVADGIEQLPAQNDMAVTPSEDDGIFVAR